MKEALFAGQGPLTEDEAKAEIDRLAREIAGMLERAKRNLEESNRMGERNRAKLAELERMLSCGNG